MGMVSMKMGDDTQVSNSQYGYGTCICLTEEQVEALGLDKNPPKPGATVAVRALAKVRRVSQTADASQEVAEGEDAGDVDVTLELQITDMEVIQQGDSDARAAALYG